VTLSCSLTLSKHVSQETSITDGIISCCCAAAGITGIKSSSSAAGKKADGKGWCTPPAAVGKGWCTPHNLETSGLAVTRVLGDTAFQAATVAVQEIIAGAAVPQKRGVTEIRQ
jgi:hypothetical protein